MAKKNTNDLQSLKKAIDASVNAVASIPPVSSQDVIDQVLPILNEAKKRVEQIETISNEIDAVRNEIIFPVKETIQQTSRINFWFSIFGMAIGAIGLCLTLYSFFKVSSLDSARISKNMKEIVANLEATNDSLKKTIAKYEAGVNILQKNAIEIKSDQRTWYERFYTPQTSTWYERFYTPQTSTWYWWMLKISILLGIVFLIYGIFSIMYPIYLYLYKERYKKVVIPALISLILGYVSWAWI